MRSICGGAGRAAAVVERGAEMSAPTTTPDVELKEAARFLGLLAGGDPAATFQTFDDRDPDNKALAGVMHGALASSRGRCAP